MQENPFKKLGRAVGIASISALSMMPLENSPTVGAENKDFNPDKNKIEWTQENLDDEKVMETVAGEIVKEKQPAYFKDMIRLFNEAIDDYSIELVKRDAMMPPTNFKYYSKEELIKEIEQLKNQVENYKDRLKKEEKTEDLIKYNAFFKHDVESKKKQIKANLSKYDEGRKWVLANINNPEYIKRLQSEVDESNKNITDTLMEKENFGDIMKQRTEDASDRNFIMSTDIKQSFGDTSEHPNVGAFYNTISNKTYFPMEINDHETAVNYAIHEYAHKVTKANMLMTPKAIELFSESFDSTSVAVNLTDIKKENLLNRLDYYSDPTEMYARKKQFDHDLERLGIKKYGEKFTLNHFIQALKLKSEGKLQYNSVEFINSVKPRKMIEVMNEIAEVDTPKDTANEQNLG